MSQSDTKTASMAQKSLSVINNKTVEQLIRVPTSTEMFTSEYLDLIAETADIGELNSWLWKRNSNPFSPIPRDNIPKQNVERLPPLEVKKLDLTPYTTTFNEDPFERKLRPSMQRLSLYLLQQEHLHGEGKSHDVFASHVHLSLTIQGMLFSWNHAEDGDSKASCLYKPLVKLTGGSLREKWHSHSMSTTQLLVERVGWIADIYAKDRRIPDQAIVVKLLMLDTKWRKSALQLLTYVEGLAFNLQHQDKYIKYTKATKSIQWPHDKQVMIAVLEAGYKSGPTVIYRDRLFCPVCKVTVSSWRSWYDPWSFHILSLHSLDEQAKILAREKFVIQT
jgi:hypothetical protein